MTTRRTFVVLGAGALAAPSVVWAKSTSSGPLPSSRSILGPGATWSPAFTGATLAVGTSIDLRTFVTSTGGSSLTFSLNPRSAPVAGVLALTPDGLLTRIGPGDLAGVIIDVDDGR